MSRSARLRETRTCWRRLTGAVRLLPSWFTIRRRMRSPRHRSRRRNERRVRNWAAPPHRRPRRRRLDGCPRNPESPGLSQCRNLDPDRGLPLYQRRSSGRACQMERSKLNLFQRVEGQSNLCPRARSKQCLGQRRRMSLRLYRSGSDQNPHRTQISNSSFPQRKRSNLRRHQRRSGPSL